MPFEWEITLPNGLWWKYDKMIYDHEFEIPNYIKDGLIWLNNQQVLI